MKVAIDTRAKPTTGIGRYTKKLLDELPILAPDDQFIGVTNNQSFTRRSVKEKYLSQLKKLYWEQQELPHLLKQMNIDLLHNPMNFGIPLKRTCPSVVTIHDVIPLTYQKDYLHSPIEKTYYRMVMNVVKNHAVKIITDSNYSRNEIVKHLGIASSRIEVIELGVGEEFKIIKEEEVLAKIKDQFKLKRPFLLTIGGSEPRKNIRALLNVYNNMSAIFEFDLVVIGGVWRDLDIKKEYQGNASVKFVGSVTQEELVSFYNLASAFIFPSYSEGFGLPILEAMACGTPVIAANASSIPEIIGDSAITFDPFNQQSMYQAILEVMGDPSLQSELISRGIEHIQHFKWTNTIKHTLHVYKEILK